MTAVHQRRAAARRNPQRTRERILAAALREFAAHGFTGARVDAIARRAGSNKRMLYHYFGDKAGLFQAALHEKIARRASLADAYPDDPAERIPAWFLTTCADAEWVRIISWESLQNPGGRAVDEKSRRKIALQHVGNIRRQQKSGVFNPATKASFALLAMASLAIFPQAFPQLTRLISGQPVTDPQFQRNYAAFLKQMAVAFRPAKAKR